MYHDARTTQFAHHILLFDMYHYSSNYTAHHTLLPYIHSVFRLTVYKTNVDLLLLQEWKSVENRHIKIICYIIIIVLKLSCPPGLRFDINDSRCDYKEDTICQGPCESPTTANPGKPLIGLNIFIYITELPK